MNKNDMKELLLSQEISRLNETINKRNDEIKQLRTDKKELIERNNKILQFAEEICIKSMDNSDWLNKFHELKKDNDELIKKYNNVSQRYNALKESKLGKLTLKYWRTKRKR